MTLVTSLGAGSAAFALVTTARILSRIGPRGQVVFTGTLPDGRIILEEDFVVDLGVSLPELERWAEDRKLDPTAMGADWRVRLGDPELSTWLRVPAGMNYDGASIPAVVQILLGDKSRWLGAATVHDALAQWCAPYFVSHRAFWIIATSGIQHVARWQANVALVALNAFSWPTWRRCARAAR